MGQTPVPVRLLSVRTLIDRRRRKPSDAERPGVVRAFARVVQAQTGLTLDLRSQSGRSVGVDELGELVDPAGLVLVLGAGQGLVALDAAGVVALVEQMTLGRLDPRGGDPRPASPLDAALIADLWPGFLRGFLGPDAPEIGQRIQDLRLLPLVLEGGCFDLTLLELDLVQGHSTRPARLVLALAPDAGTAEAQPAPDPVWSRAMETAVMAAPVGIDAALARLDWSLAQVLALQVGHSITLPLAHLEEITLTLPDGATAQGRLGQYRGMRAIRLTRGFGEPQE
jgi:hypothetical protein